MPRRQRRAAVAYLIFAATLATLLPLTLLLKSAATGFSSLLENFALGGDLAASLLFATSAACAVIFLARLLARRPLAAMAVASLGLIGALPLALGVVSIFQTPLLRPLYNTPLPLLFVLSIVLFPFALLLRWLLTAMRADPALHLAALLNHSGLLWELKGSREFWAGFLLFCSAYFDLTASAIVAPVGMTPVFVRLYNLMHYGQTAVLSSMVCITFAVPFAIASAVKPARAIHGILTRGSS